MARSARASVRKINRTNLRSKVFGPVYDARTQRLSAKLMELASQPKAKTEMEVEQPATSQNTIDTEAKETDPVDDTVMDVDDTAKRGQTLKQSRTAEKKRKEEKSSRIEKKRHRKAKNSIHFPKKIQKPKK